MNVRRTLQRTRRMLGMDDAALAAELKAERRRLSNEIKAQKQGAWKKLCAEIDNNPWGHSYQIVMKKFGMCLPTLTEEQVRDAVRELFPAQQHQWRRIEPGLPQPFTVKELRMATKEINIKKSPGPDGVPGLVTKQLIEKCPEQVLKAINIAAQRGQFPECWKEARLVLLPKAEIQPGIAGGYRPLC